jgi:hypothetical protein
MLMINAAGGGLRTIVPAGRKRIFRTMLASGAVGFRRAFSKERKEL